MRQRLTLARAYAVRPELLPPGVGPAELLRRHGIEVVADVAGVGENLQDHYQARTIVRLRMRTSLNDDAARYRRLSHADDHLGEHQRTVDRHR